MLAGCKDFILMHFNVAAKIGILAEATSFRLNKPCQVGHCFVTSVIIGQLKLYSGPTKYFVFYSKNIGAHVQYILSVLKRYCSFVTLSPPYD